MPKTAIKEERKPAPSRTAHPHHWVIASPNGEYSLGTCKICGKTRKFPNSAEDFLWARNEPKSRWTGRADDGGMSGY